MQLVSCAHLTVGIESFVPFPNPAPAWFASLGKSMAFSAWQAACFTTTLCWQCRYVDTDYLPGRKGPVSDQYLLRWDYHGYRWNLNLLKRATLPHHHRAHLRRHGDN